jgi:hypothetical protein
MKKLLTIWILDTVINCSGTWLDTNINLILGKCSENKFDKFKNGGSMTGPQAYCIHSGKSWAGGIKCNSEVFQVECK